MSAVRDKQMARKKQEPQGSQQPPGGDDKTTTKVYVKHIRKAKMIAAYQGTDMFDLLDGIIGPAIDRLYDQMIEKEAE